MSELKATTAQEIVREEKDCDYMDELFGGVKMPPTQVYLKSEADKVIADLEESHKMEVEQLLIEIAELKNRIAPKQSDKTLQERLNEVCKKHGVSTLQDLDWAFCESENRHTKDCIEAVRLLRHSNHKRCLAMAKYCELREDEFGGDFAKRWLKKWLALAEEPTWEKFLQLIHKEEK